MTSTALSDVLERHHQYIGELFERVSSPDEDRPEVLKELLRELSADVSAERSLVLPVVTSRADAASDDQASSRSGNEPSADDLEADFKEIERLLILIERRKVNSPDMPELVTALKDASEQHISHMAALLPGLDEALPPDEADDLASEFENQEESLASHPHPHLLSVKPLAGIATKLAAHYDRVRDRTVDNRHGK